MLNWLMAGDFNTLMVWCHGQILAVTPTIFVIGTSQLRVADFVTWLDGIGCRMVLPRVAKSPNLFHLRSHLLQYLGMLEESVEHERANAGGCVHAHQVGSQNVRKQVRIGEELGIRLARFQQLINKVQRLVRMSFPVMGLHDPLVKLRDPPLGPAVPGQALHRLG